MAIEKTIKINVESGNSKQELQKISDATDKVNKKSCLLYTSDAADED